MTKVIFDGECAFCRSCVDWISSRCQIDAIPNQKINPNDYGVTREECEKSVVVIDNEIYFGAEAVAFLLKRSGYRNFARLLQLSGPVGEMGYRYVANNRDGKLVALLHWIIRRGIL